MTTLEQLKNDYKTQDVWAFPKDYNFLYDAVKEGKKTATSSYYPKYAYRNQPIPIEKGYTILLNDQENPSQALVMIWSEVRIFPFNELADDLPPAEMMDRQTWMDIHKRDFLAGAKAMGQEFNETDKTLAKFFTVQKVVDLK